jgi:hypothetical protein
VSCTYTIFAPIEVEGGSPAALRYNETTVGKTAGGFLCPSELKMDAEYNVESPTPLYVEQQ